MKCPSCKSPLTSPDHCDHCAWRKKSRPVSSANSNDTSIDHYCPRCGVYGYITESTRGGGPWYCRDHFPYFAQDGVAVPQLSKGDFDSKIAGLTEHLRMKRAPVPEIDEEVLVQEEPGAMG